MTNKSKSILDQAYDEARTLEEALKQNAKDLLSATMKTDLEDLVKESLEDEDSEEDVEDVDVETDDDDVDADVDVDNDDEIETDGDGDADADDMGIEDMDMDDDNDELAAIGDDSDIATDIEEPTDDIEPMDTGSDVVDMTQATDADVLQVFKKMGPEDGIVVTRDAEGNLDVNTGTEEFKIMTNETSMEDEEGLENLDTDEDSIEGDEVMYELNMDGLDEEMYEDKNSPFDGKGSNVGKNAPYTGKSSVGKDAPYETKNKVQAVSEADDIESEMRENKPRVKANRFRTTGNNQNAGPYTDGTRQTRGALQQNEELVRYQKLVESLKTENKNFKKAVEDFKKKLHEVAVFNSNLAYAVRLFTENTTTKKEKINILRRFDNVKNLSESKQLFESVTSELGSSVIKESKSVDEKITKTPQTGSVAQPKTQIFESKIYEDPKFKRSLDIMKKINK
jgi:hypothetical protein